MQVKNRIFYLIIAVMLMVTASLGSLALMAPADEVQAQNVDCYREQGGSKNVAASGCEYEFQSGATLDIQSGVTFTNGGWEQLTAQTAISLTDGAVLTPTGSYQPIQSGGAVTATLSSGCTAGRRVTFINTVDQTIIISETATSALSGNASLGQYDALTVLCDGTRWVQTAPESDN